MDRDDRHNPIKSETIMNRSFLKEYTPSWGHNNMRINKFSDSGNIWNPFPIPSQEQETFINLLHNENQHRSNWNDIDNLYKFSSYEIFLDVDINYISRRYDTVINFIG